MLEEVFMKVRTLQSVPKYTVTPASNNHIQTKVFSEANMFNTTHVVYVQNEEYEVEDIRGFVTPNMAK
jgi:hypothetical protein